MEKLTYSIMEKMNVGHWKLIKVGKHGSHISHLIFVDNLLWFVKAFMDQIAYIDAYLNFVKYHDRELTI